MIDPPGEAGRFVLGHQFGHQGRWSAYVAGMATGSKRRRGDSWQPRVYAGLHPVTGKRGYVTTFVQGSEREADRALRRLLDEVEDASRVPAVGRRTFRDAAEKWLAACRPDMSPATVMTTEDYLQRYLLPYLGDRPVERIGAEDLDALYGELRSRAGRGGRSLSPALTTSRAHALEIRGPTRARSPSGSTTSGGPGAAERGPLWS